MSADARFHDGADMPLRLLAQGPEDLPAISALLQDAVFTGADVAYIAARRRFALLLSRFRWEDRAAAEAAGRPYERVQSLLVIDNVLSLRRAGYDPQDRAQVQALLALSYAPRDSLGGRLSLVLAGAALAAPTIAIEVETIDISLRDTARPHYAQSKSAPDHGA
jgi:hypothetical protein